MASTDPVTNGTIQPSTQTGAQAPAPAPSSALPGSPPAAQLVQSPSYMPAVATANTYEATPYEVKPQGLVQERLKGIIDQDSPLMQQAARIATQKSNARGLIDSSMAAGDAQQAVIAAATPIATTDANAINTAMMKTADQQNAASQFGAQAQNNASLANQSAYNTERGQELQGTIQLTNTQMTANAQAALARLDADTKLRLSTMDANTRSLLQTNQSASNAYVQTIANISAIQNNDKMDAAAKKNAIDAQFTMLKEQLGVLQATSQQVDQQTKSPQSVVDLNLGNYFNADFTPKADPSGYLKAQQDWAASEAAHIQRYGIPIPQAAYKDGYRPPRAADYGL